MSVEQDYAAYLKADALLVTVAAPDAVHWPEGRRAECSSSLATVGGGLGEAERQARFLGGAKVGDKAVVAGQRRDLLGRAITLVGTRLGYSGGAPVFVLGAEEKADGTTILTVLRKLG